jgi:hypothetical protein
MSNIVVFRVTGLSPLLVNNPAGMTRSDPNTVGTKKIPTPEEEAKAKLYVNADGNYYILSEAFRSSIIGKGGGASGRKMGKRSAISIVSGALFTVEPHAVLLDPDTWKPLKKYEIDTRRAVVQNQGVLRSRPMFPKWGVRIPLDLDQDFLQPNTVLELLNLSGKIAGVGDFRPQHKGAFGRYQCEIENGTGRK